MPESDRIVPCPLPGAGPGGLTTIQAERGENRNEKLDADELDALVIPALSVNSDFIAIANIGASDC